MKKLITLFCLIATLTAPLKKAHAGTILITGGAVSMAFGSSRHGSDGLLHMMGGIGAMVIGGVSAAIGRVLLVNGHKRAAIIFIVLDTQSESQTRDEERDGLYHGLINLGEADADASYIAETAQRTELENGIIEYSHPDINEEKLQSVFEQINSI